MALSKREQNLLLVTAAVAVIGFASIGWGLLSRDTGSEVSSATAERFEELFAKMGNVDTQKNRNLLLRKKIGNMEGTFAGEKDVSILIAELEKTAQQSGIQIKNWSPSVNSRAKPFAQLDIKITIECKFDQLIKFLDNVRTAKYLLQPTSIKASLKDKNKPELDVAMTLGTYLLDAKPPKTEPTKAIVRNPS